MSPSLRHAAIVKKRARVEGTGAGTSRVSVQGSLHWSEPCDGHRLAQDSDRRRMHAR